MSTKPVRIVGILSIIVGVIMLVAGAVVWGVVTSELAAERITTPADAAFLPNQPVNNPLTAVAQAEIINHHALTASDGKTYAELGTLASDATKAGNKDLAAKYTATRTTVMTASFLRASLFTSVLSYGVCLMAMGLGLMLGLIGWALMAVAKGLNPAAAERKAVPVAVKAAE
jgi:hypothetical protein